MEYQLTGWFFLTFEGGIKEKEVHAVQLQVYNSDWS